MQPIIVEELINYKILPFNIYTKGDKLLFPAGEVLTPGKFLQLRHIKVIYRKEEEDQQQVLKPTRPTAPQPAEDETEPQPEAQPQVVSAPPPPPAPEPEPDPDVISYIAPEMTESIDDLDVRNIILPVNKISKITPQDQIRLKVYYDQMVSNPENISPSKMLNKFKNIRNKIQEDYASLIDSATHSSQIRLVGEYDRCHAINTAILTAALARKLGKNEDYIAEITLAALLHDIGKICLPKNITFKPNMTIQEQKLYQAHAKIGYNIIKNKMNLGEKIARVALEHHERNDGTGFPHGKSGDFISLESQIISVCNYFDNLTFNKTPHKISNGKEALKIMLEMGSKYFAIDILYSFIYMYNYDDTMSIDEMTVQ